MRINFNQYGEIFEYPENAYSLIYDPKSNNTYKTKTLNDGYKYKEIKVSSAEILAIGTSAKELLPAAGLGYYYDFKGYIELTFGTTAYSTSAQLSIQQGVDRKMGLGLILQSTENTSAIFNPIASTGGVAIVGFYAPLNKQLLLSTANGVNPTTGDSTLTIKLWYKKIKFNS